MKIQSLLRFAAFFFVCTSAVAQTGGVLSPGQVLGNAGPNPGPAKPVQSTFVHVKDFGAKCDGVTDDTVAIQGAGNQAIAQGAALYVDPSINGCVVSQNGANSYALLWQAPITIIGNPGRSIIRPANGLSSSVAIIYLIGSSTIGFEPTIIDGIFIGNPSAGTRTGGHAIVFDTLVAGQDFSRPIIKNNYLQQSASGTGWSVFAINSQTNNPVGGFRQAIFEKNIIGSGIALNKSGDSISIFSNTFFGTSSNAGIYVDQVNGSFGGAGNVVISQNNMGPNAGSIIVDCGQSVLISENEIEQGGVSTEVNNSLIDIKGSTCTVASPRIVNNQIQASSGMGNPTLVRIATATSALVDHNQISTPADYVPIVITAGSTGAIIGAGNTFTGMTTQVTNGGASTLQGVNVPYGSGGTSQILKRATANGPVTVAQAAVGELGVIAANTLIGNQSGSTANPAAFSMPSCSTSASALTWTSGAGIGCNAAISVAVANVTGLGTGVATALGVNTGTAGSHVVNGGALGTPSSGTLTNATGLPTTGLSGTLQAAQEPAHTGDMTNTAGSLATTVTKINGVDMTTAWTQTTPAVTCGSGTPTNVTATWRQKLVGKTAFVTVTITNTTNGTCAGYYTMTSPFTPFQNSAMYCMETATQISGQARFFSNAIFVTKYDSTFLGGTGSLISCVGTVETQ